MEIKIGFGIGFNRDGQPIRPKERTEALVNIRNKACELFGGCNMVHGQGSWESPEGRIVDEPSVTLIIWVTGNPVDIGRHCLNARKLASFIRQLLNQHTVLIHYTDGDLGEAEEYDEGPAV